MKLNPEQVRHIAQLARLALTDDEIEQFRDQLSAILEYADRLQQVDTGDILPTASVLPVDTILREDEVTAGLSRDTVLKNAEETEAGMFRVDVILD